MLQRKPRTHMGMVSVYTAQGMLQAQVIKSKLDTVGIPCLLEYESYGQVLGLTVDGLGAVHVMVPRALEREARAALEPTSQDDDVQDDSQPQGPDAET